VNLYAEAANVFDAAFNHRGNTLTELAPADRDRRVAALRRGQP